MLFKIEQSYSPQDYLVSLQEECLCVAEVGTRNYTLCPAMD